jgi:hypothetical protein
VYWVRNSLTDSVGNGELLAIAEQTQPFTAVHSTHRVPVILRAVGVPTRTAATKPISTRLMVGGLAGLVTLLALPLLGFLAVRRIMDLRRARPDMALGQQAGERLAASGGLASVAPEPPAIAELRRVLGLGGNGALSAGGSHVASGRWSGGTRVYRRSRLRTPAVLVSTLVVLVAIAAAVAYVVATVHDVRRHSHVAVRRHHAPGVPRVPVVVLNATSTPGAAHQLALRLQARHVSVSAVGNVTETRPAGIEILYASGERSQAKLLARMMASRRPTVALIDPVTSAAAAGAKLVVVIS